MFKRTFLFFQFFCIGQLFLLPSLLFSQEQSFGIPDLTQVKLPSLEVLFENARQSPSIEMLDVRVQLQDNQLTTEQRSWLKYFKVGGSYQYGNIAINSAFTNENTPLFMQSSGQIQNSWYGTAGVSIPLDDIFDRKNRIDKVKKEKRFAELEREKWLDEQRMRITDSYMRVRLFLSILSKKVEVYNIAKANFQILEKEFKNGAATISDLNTGKKQETEANDALKGNEFDLLSEIIKLEILSKTKIISK